MKKVIAFVLCVSLCVLSFAGCGTENDASSSTTPSKNDSIISIDTPIGDNNPSSSNPSSSNPSSSNPTSSTPTSSKPVSSHQPTIDSNPKVKVEGTPSWKCTAVSHNTGVNIDDNIFMDSLIYTGYNIEKHRSDGAMWQYVLAARKRGYGWLSKIGYGGGCSGYETTADGKPDIARFERGKLDCASYVTYVYFNYLPNVAGIDTSSLDKPKLSWKAQSVYEACQEWEKKGLSRRIDFTSSGKPGQYLKLEEKEEIPIGSIVCLKDARKPNSTTCSHVSIYAGYANNYHWVYHIGNDNGPEFCAIERMTFGPDPQYMLAIFTTPQFILDKMK